MPVPAANIVLAVLAHIGGPLMAVPSPAEDPKPDKADSHSRMTISIADNMHEVRGGQRVRYQIMVSNPTRTEAPVTIRLTLPSSVVTSIRAEQATVVANAVAWKNRLAAGETRSYFLMGTVERRVDASDIAITACLHAASEAPALTCATDLNSVAAGPTDSPGLTWIAAIVFGLLAAMGAVWLQKKIQPDRLTPANAASTYGEEPGQPGGTPSV